eukprot:10835136-Alexandrium_andersonii.AAC.1
MTNCIRFGWAGLLRVALVAVALNANDFKPLDLSGVGSRLHWHDHDPPRRRLNSRERKEAARSAARLRRLWQPHWASTRIEQAEALWDPLAWVRVRPR